MIEIILRTNYTNYLYKKLEFTQGSVCKLFVRGCYVRENGAPEEARASRLQIFYSAIMNVDCLSKDTQSYPSIVGSSSSRFRKMLRVQILSAKVDVFYAQGD